MDRRRCHQSSHHPSTRSFLPTSPVLINQHLFSPYLSMRPNNLRLLLSSVVVPPFHTLHYIPCVLSLYVVSNNLRQRKLQRLPTRRHRQRPHAHSQEPQPDQTNPATPSSSFLLQSLALPWFGPLVWPPVFSLPSYHQSKHLLVERLQQGYYCFSHEVSKPLASCLVPPELQEFSMCSLQDMSSISFIETNLQSFSLSLEQLQSFCLSGGKAGANPVDTEFLSSPRFRSRARFLLSVEILTWRCSCPVNSFSG
jgi:hypothetical protein